MRILNQIAKAVSQVFGKNNEQVTIRANDIVTPKYEPECLESIKSFETELTRLQSAPVPAAVPQVKVHVKEPWEIQLENMPVETRYILGKFLMAPSKDYTGMKDLLTTYDTNEKLLAYLNTKPGIRKARKTGVHYNLESIMQEE